MNTTKRLLRGLALATAAVLMLLAGCGNDEFEPIGTLDPDVPFAVTDLAITVVGDTVRVTWTATGDDGPVGTAARYDFRRHSEAITSGNWHEATPLVEVPRPRPAGTAETFDLDVGPEEPAFFLALQVVDDSGNVSSLSNVVFLDRRPPDVITDLAIRNVTYGSAVLAWTAPADDGPAGVATRYEIRASTGNLDEAVWADLRPALDVNAATPAGQEQIVGLPGLDPQTSYRFAVRARDSAGNLSGLSNIAASTTRAEPRGWWDGFVGQGTFGTVAALLATPDTLYVAGRFAAAGGLAVGNIAAWDGAAWHAMGRGLSAGRFGTLGTDFANFGGKLFVSGDFTIAGNQPVANLAAWTGAGWENPGGGPTEFPPIVLEVWRGDLYIGGYFRGPAGSAFNRLSRFDGTTFHGTGWPGSATGGYPQVLFGRENDMVVAGLFEDTPVGGAVSIADWDGGGFTAPYAPLDGRLEVPVINDVIEYRGELIVGGDFPAAGGVALNGIARWDGVRWQPLGSGMSDTDFPSVSALAVYGDYLVAAGSFGSAGGRPANNIALWDGFAWQAMGLGLEAEGFANGSELTIFQGSLFVGGQFETAGGLESPNIARWDLD